MTRTAPARIEMTADLFDLVLSRLADGEMLEKLCEEPGMPSRSTVYAWMRGTPGARARMDEAIEARADWRIGKISELAGKAENGLVDPQSARVAIDAHKFIAARENPRRYGDKSAVQLSGKDGKDLISEKERDDLELARYFALVLTRAKKQIEQQESQE
jgi:hypothetical protein